MTTGRINQVRRLVDPLLSPEEEKAQAKDDDGLIYKTCVR
jgi:hypothetical protein